MRAKEDLLNDLGITQEYNPRGGLHPDTKDVVLIEVLIDIRDLIRAAGKDIQEAIWNMPGKD
ncbi:hypothetical protein ES703_113006 [subsurface metagenome]